jgi:hypothetical protein
MCARLRLGLAAATLSLACASAAQAAPLAYAAGFDDLFRIDLATGAATRIGAFGTIGTTPIVDVEGLAFAPDGSLYGVSDGLNVLLRIDTTTARATAIGVLRENGQPLPSDRGLDVGLTFTCDGRLWMSSEGLARLWQVNLSTAELTRAGDTVARISGLAARGNRLVGLGVLGDEGLWSIDRDTGAATLATRLVPAALFRDAGLDYDANGQLWGARHSFPPTLRSDVFRIDPATGATVPLAEVTFGAGIEDKTIETIAIAPPGGCSDNPVGPPPTGLVPNALAVPASSPGALATLAALLVLVAGLVLRRRRAATTGARA